MSGLPFHPKPPRLPIRPALGRPHVPRRGALSTRPRARTSPRPPAVVPRRGSACSRMNAAGSPEFNLPLGHRARRGGWLTAALNHTPAPPYRGTTRFRYITWRAAWSAFGGWRRETASAALPHLPRERRNRDVRRPIWAR